MLSSSFTAPVVSWLASVLVAVTPPAPGKTPPPRVAAAAPAAPAAAPALAEIIAAVQKYYDGAQSYRADFEQAQLNATFGRTKRSSGEVLFKKPGRMRWNYAGADKKAFVSNGQVLWLYEPADKQAIKQSLAGSQLPAALSFLMGKGKLGSEFVITIADKLSYGQPGDYRLSLKPKQPQSQYKAIYFIVDPKTFQVKQSVLVDGQGNVNDISFKNAKANVKLPDTTFNFVPPKGVRVVDAAKLGTPAK